MMEDLDKRSNNHANFGEIHAGNLSQGRTMVLTF